MEAFYICIIFLGVILVLGSLFFILMDRVNGKDFFKEFDRKKEEMFNMIQDSEEMIQELNRMSDYVVDVISEKNQEFFEKANRKEETKPELNKTNKLSEAVKEEDRNNNIDISISDSIQINKIKDIAEKYKVVDSISTPIAKSAGQESGIQELDEAKPPITQLVDRNIDDPKKLSFNDKRSQAIDMIEQGLSNEEISKKLKIGKGELGLIRGLRR